MKHKKIIKNNQSLKKLNARKIKNAFNNIKKILNYHYEKLRLLKIFIFWNILKINKAMSDKHNKAFILFFA